MNQGVTLVNVYHSSLRVAVLVVTTVLIFESGMVGSVTKNLVDSSGQKLVSMVGMSASIAPNDINVITAQLTEKEQQLALRESAVAKREIAVSVGGGGDVQGERVTFMLATVLFILLLLIILNYILDYMHRKEQLRSL